MFNKDIMKDLPVQSLKITACRSNLSLWYTSEPLTSVLFVLSLFGISDAQSSYTLTIAVILADGFCQFC